MLAVLILPLPLPLARVKAWQGDMTKNGLHSVHLRIGYCPAKVDLDPAINEDYASQVGGAFTPVKRPGKDADQLNGVSIKIFPKETCQ